MTMRLASKAREQAELPAGYQFGDARAPEPDLEGATIIIDGVLHVLHHPAWRPPHLNAAERLQRAGERLNALPVPKRSAEDLAMIAEVNGWNVKE